MNVYKRGQFYRDNNQIIKITKIINYPGYQKVYFKTVKSNFSWRYYTSYFYSHGHVYTHLTLMDNIDKATLL